MRAGTGADEEAARLPTAAEHPSSAESALPPPPCSAVPRPTLQLTLAATTPQSGVVLLLMTLVGTFFAILAPAMEPRALRSAVQSTYAVLAAMTIALLTATTCDAHASSSSYLV